MKLKRQGNELFIQSKDLLAVFNYYLKDFESITNALKLYVDFEGTIS